MTWTKERVRILLASNDKAVERAIIALYRRQTLDEQNDGETRYSNGVGFSGAHANLGSYCARWILDGKSLSGPYLNRARIMVLHYVDQLMDCIEQKAA